MTKHCVLTGGICSKDVTVDGAKMHYRQCGQGSSTIVLIHGMPTSSYLWREIMPSLADDAVCYAPDLIGMGESDKPNITYSIDDHIRYITGFIDALSLKNIILVLHGWGSVIGLHYASLHPNNVRAVATCEGHIRPIDQWDMLALPVQHLAILLRNKEASFQAIVEDNYFIDKLLPHCALNPLSADVLDSYRQPFLTPEDRHVLWQYVQELPLGNPEAPVTDLIRRYNDWLSQSPIPKLLLYAMPGFMTPVDNVAWAMEHWLNVTCVELPDAMHLAQESCPELFTSALRQWLHEAVLDEK